VGRRGGRWIGVPRGGGEISVCVGVLRGEGNGGGDGGGDGWRDEGWGRRWRGWGMDGGERRGEG